MTDNPYQNFPPEAFWRSAVAERAPEEIRGLWTPKFDITREMRIVTAGSCFAQHISRAFRDRGYNWYNAETAPGSPELALAYNYGVFSFRTGNIYTARMLNQWFRWARSPEDCPDLFWTTGKRHFDPFRPAVEPDGFASLDEARASRAATLAAIADAMRKADVFVFTMGLTECWRDRDSGVEYAICPGTVAGEFDPETHLFHSMNYSEVVREMGRALANLRRLNRNAKVLLTVSPVPLTATASGQHVLTATSQSKSVLRAAAGALAAENDYVDYFPSYEIITHPVFGGKFYAPNKRSVRPEGVAFVMQNFFHDLDTAFGRDPEAAPEAPETPVAGAAEAEADADLDDVKCEEEMLAAFQGRG